jgi:hypothetical protein
MVAEEAQPIVQAARSREKSASRPGWEPGAGLQVAWLVLKCASSPPVILTFALPVSVTPQLATRTAAASTPSAVNRPPCAVESGSGG